MGNNHGGSRSGQSQGSGGRSGGGGGSQPAPRAAPATSRAGWKIDDRYQTLEQVQQALRTAGLESSNLIVGVDFTKSNSWTGKNSFGGRNLHALVPGMMNSYEQVLSIVGQTLETFDDDHLIPCYGFGDAQTKDQSVFSFYEQDRPCQGLQQALQRYREIAEHILMAGPTSFGPLIRKATDIVAQAKTYHILIIVADGQVTRSSDTDDTQISIHEQDTIDAIVEASFYPLSIVMIGVGDGPFDTMKEFDDRIPHREFDNFQFVEFNTILRGSHNNANREAMFALNALMEIPEQYQYVTSRRTPAPPRRAPVVVLGPAAVGCPERAAGAPVAGAPVYGGAPPAAAPYAQAPPAGAPYAQAPPPSAPYAQGPPYSDAPPAYTYDTAPSAPPM